MKLVIDIPEEVYKCVMDGTWCGSLYEELKNGVPVEPCEDCVSRQAVANMLDTMEMSADETWMDLYRKALSGLAALPSVTPEPETSDDCVSRKDTIAWLKKVTVTDGITFETGFKQIIRDIEQMPSVAPERPHGYWIWNKRTGDYECSECGCNPIYERTTPDVSEIDKYRFCRWCGAKMEVHHGKENS